MGIITDTDLQMLTITGNNHRIFADEEQLNVVTNADGQRRLLQANCTKDCGEHGYCRIILGTYKCICSRTFVNRGNKPCNYEAKSKLVTFLLAFLVGELGTDWFYLSRGDTLYIVAGVFKLLTMGGCGIWWFVDWIRIAANAFPD